MEAGDVGEKEILNVGKHVLYQPGRKDQARLFLPKHCTGITVTAVGMWDGTVPSGVKT